MVGCSHVDHVGSRTHVVEVHDEAHPLRERPPDVSAIRHRDLLEADHWVHVDLPGKFFLNVVNFLNRT